MLLVDKVKAPASVWDLWRITEGAEDGHTLRDLSEVFSHDKLTGWTRLIRQFEKKLSAMHARGGVVETYNRRLYGAGGSLGYLLGGPNTGPETDEHGPEYGISYGFTSNNGLRDKSYSDSRTSSSSGSNSTRRSSRSRTSVAERMLWQRLLELYWLGVDRV